MFQVLFVVILFAWSLESVCQVTVYYDLFLFCSSLFYLSGYFSLELFVQVLFFYFCLCMYCLFGYCLALFVRAFCFRYTKISRYCLLELCLFWHLFFRYQYTRQVPILTNVFPDMFPYSDKFPLC